MLCEPYQPRAANKGVGTEDEKGLGIGSHHECRPPRPGFTMLFEVRNLVDAFRPTRYPETRDWREKIQTQCQSNRIFTM